MSVNYKLKDNTIVEDKVTFLRVETIGKRNTLGEIYHELSDMSWITNMVPKILVESYQNRVKITLDKIDEIISKSTDISEVDAIVTDASEYIISVISKEVVVRELKYFDIPLSELYKQQKSQNPGFDFHSINNDDVLLFGEAKFVSKQNAYGRALKQIVDFIRDKKDSLDLPDLYIILTEGGVAKAAFENFKKGKKGFMAGFSTTDIATEILMDNIKINNDYSNVKQYDELVLIAVDLK